MNLLFTFSQNNPVKKALFKATLLSLVCVSSVGQADPHVAKNQPLKLNQILQDMLKQPNPRQVAPCPRYPRCDELSTPQNDEKNSATTPQQPKKTG